MTAPAPGAGPPPSPTFDPAAPLLRVRDLGIRYEDAEAATPASASLDITAGDVVLLLGPSGSGKSSLALALNGLIPQAIPATVTGSVRIAGADATARTVAQLSTRVGMVFQDPDAQVVTGTLRDEVAFGPENLCLPADEVLTRTEAALRRVGLWDRRDENPDLLSGGGRQRLSIACALAMHSPLLVLDEPTANLDPSGIDEVYAALADLTGGDDPRAVLLVEHNLDAAVAFTTRVVVLDAAGRTVADGPVDEVLRGRAADLHAMGVWLPISTIAALQLQDAGWHFERIPLTPEELSAAVDTPGAAPRSPASAPTPARPAPTPPAPAPPRSPRNHVRREAHAGHAGLTTEVASRGESAGATGPIVEVAGLTLRRGRTEVLRGVDLTIGAGEFVAIIGANGAGKTSLLQAIAGVVPVPKRTVRVGGVDVARADRRALSRRVGFVFQNPEHQFIAHTVWDELAHGLRQRNVPDAEVTASVTDILRRFGLEPHAHRHPFLLSGGQKRRLSVGTALIAGAEVLALDEPTFGQDRARADELLRLLHGLNDAGSTIIIVSHDMHLVAEYVDRAIVVADGRVVADDTPAAVFADDELLARTHLRPPPLARALHRVQHPLLAGRARLADLPGSDIGPRRVGGPSPAPGSAWPGVVA